MSAQRIGRLVCVAAFVVVLGSAPVAAAEPVDPDQCKRQLGTSAPRSTWALDRLEVARVAPVNRGVDVRTGKPIRVAVIDSGLDKTHNRLLRGIRSTPVQYAIPGDPRRYTDCISHGTQVTAIIAAQPDASHPDFVGVAPDVEIIPIKITEGGSYTGPILARGIDRAIAAGAQIANMSLAGSGDDPRVKAAVARARSAGMLIVAAAGNDGTDQNATIQYPAAYATRFDNVLAVTSMTEQNTITDYSSSGSYVGVTAPGENVQSVGVNGGYRVVQGTSFAAPYVTGVAALVLATHPGMSAADIRNRIEATADSPPVSTPDDRWGWGVVDPYLAVSSLRGDAPPQQATQSRRPPVAFDDVVAAPDRTLQHVALAVALGMLGIAAVVVVAATVWRGRRRHG